MPKHVSQYAERTPMIQLENHPDSENYAVLKFSIPVAWLNLLIRGEMDTVMLDRDELLPIIEDFKQRF
jgi:hypothetical protein